jgi:predicted HAD superfamily Cof-like phosphohydrolase
MLSNFDRVKQFHEKFDILSRDTPGFPEDLNRIAIRGGKIEEELFEFREEIAKVQFEGLPESEEEKKQLLAFILGEAIDCIYVFYGLFAECGVDADEVFAAIHKANMTKTLGENGKIIKGASFTPANLKDVIFERETV